MRVEKMDQLWSPWRMNYIMNHEKTKDCVFCQALETADSVQNLIVFRGKYSFVILNRFPYSSGHLMIVPFEHHASLEELNTETLSEMMLLMTHAMRVLRAVYRPDAFNIGANIGEAAGAGIAEHVHMHVVPRWAGDTNFMSTIGTTRVLPENLEDTYQRVSSQWEQMPLP